MKQTNNVDIQEEADHVAASGSTGAQLAKLAGARSTVAVPMIREDELIGAILIFRQEVQPFTDKQIELLHELCRPGRHRHRERAAAQGAAPAHRRSFRVVGAADGDLGGAKGYLKLSR